MINLKKWLDGKKEKYLNLSKFKRPEKLTKLKEYMTSEKLKKLVKHKYFLLAVGMIAAVVIGGTVLTVKENKKYDITTNKAEEYFYIGEYGKAIDEYNAIAAKDKNSPLWNLKIAEVYSVKGDIENSRKYILKVKDASSKDPEILNLLVFTEFMNKDYKVASEDGEKALNLIPRDKKLIKTMFTVYMANNELDKAKVLIKLYDVDKKSAYDTSEYARMLMLLDQWDEGLKLLRDAWTIDKDEYKIYDTLSQIAVYNKDKLLENVTGLSSKNPNDMAYKMWLAKIYSGASETAPQAADLIKSLQGKDTGKIEIKLIESAVLQNSGETAKADDMISTLIKDNGDDYRILHTAGWYYLNKNEIDKAEKYCKESIVKNKNYPDNYGFLMPEILKAKGNSMEGEPYFRTALYLEPYNYNIMLNIANYYWNTAKNTDKALEYFKFAEIVKPEDAEIKYNMALIYLTNGKNDDAVKLLNQCIKIDDVVPKYHRTLGTIYLLHKDTASAIKEIRYAYHGDENDIMTLNNAGCYYISIEGSLDRGLFNLQMAYKGINKNTDKYTKQVIEGNYNKVKKLVDDFKNGKPNQKLQVPDLTLFY
jgi:tetratricopeptide (TPR) repeat protein